MRRSGFCCWSSGAKALNSLWKASTLDSIDVGFRFRTTMMIAGLIVPIILIYYPLMLASVNGNAEIASSLYLSQATIKSHITRILSRLGLRDRVQIAVYAYEHGIVRPGHVG